MELELEAGLSAGMHQFNPHADAVGVVDRAADWDELMAALVSAGWWACGVENLAISSLPHFAVP